MVNLCPKNKYNSAQPSLNPTLSSIIIYFWNWYIMVNGSTSNTLDSATAVKGKTAFLEMMVLFRLHARLHWALLVRAYKNCTCSIACQMRTVEKRRGFWSYLCTTLLCLISVNLSTYISTWINLQWLYFLCQNLRLRRNSTISPAEVKAVYFSIRKTILTQMARWEELLCGKWEGQREGSPENPVLFPILCSLFLCCLLPFGFHQTRRSCQQHEGGCTSTFTTVRRMWIQQFSIKSLLLNHSFQPLTRCPPEHTCLQKQFANSVEQSLDIPLHLCMYSSTFSPMCVLLWDRQCFHFVF